MAAAHTARLRRFDAAIAVSRATADAMDEKWHPSRPITVIPNGVDPVGHASTRARPADPVPGPPRPGEAACPPGRCLRRARRDHPEATLTLAGTRRRGDDPASSRSTRLGLTSSVSLPGFVDPVAAMAEHDVLAMLSVWENCSYALLDAAAHGLGVVASRRRRQPRDPPAGLPGRAPTTPTRSRTLWRRRASSPSCDRDWQTGRPWPTCASASPRCTPPTDDNHEPRSSRPWSPARPDEVRAARAAPGGPHRRLRALALLPLAQPRGARASPSTSWPWRPRRPGRPAVARPATQGCTHRVAWLSAGALLALLIYSGMANDIDWTRRVGHVAILAGLSGRAAPAESRCARRRSALPRV